VRAVEAAPVTVAEARALFSDLEYFPTLVLAVSGGPDSIALMWLAARWRDALKAPPKLIAVTVDHGLRKESKGEAAAVARLAGKLGVAHRALRWIGKKPATGLQQAARGERYRLLTQAARKAGASHILTAHTLDDQAETVLIRLSRGSGLKGLAAMQRVSVVPARESSAPLRASSTHYGGPILDADASGFRTHDQAAAPRNDDVFLVRPLLDLPKARLIATLKAAEIAYADDPSNRDPRFTRARLRGLMPELAREGLDASRLALLARRLKRADQAIEAATDRAFTELQRDPILSGSIILCSQGYSELSPEIALRLLGRAVGWTGNEGPVELAKLEALKTALDAAQKRSHGRFRRSLAGAVVTLAPGRITVEQAPPRRGNALTTRRPGNAKPAKRR
jgi:tRNA(Ile)-lysidine synthase